MNTQLPRPALQRSMPGSAAGCRGGSYRSSSARALRAGPACSLRCWPPPPARGELGRPHRRARHVRSRIGGGGRSSTCDRMLWIRGHVRRCTRAVPRHESAGDGAGDPRAHAGAAGRQFRAGCVRCRRSAGRRLAAACRSPPGCGCSGWSKARQTVGVLMGSEPMARSAAGLTLNLAPRRAVRFGARLFDGLDMDARGRLRQHEGSRPHGGSRSAGRHGELFHDRRLCLSPGLCVRLAAGGYGR